MPPQEEKTNTQEDFSQVVEKIKNTNNVLVTVSNNPTIDQFAACIGLTLILNKLGKHATAVFSGHVPDTIDFLKPEKIIEKNTDSLRDFIIALDKSKADKLRYKVENNVVKIFITPYKTSISEKDLDFSQGDFNVDAVVALGVQDKMHLDAAILAHGRILHDATVISINNSLGSQLGSINWLDIRASSLCEMTADVARELSSNVFDNQNATALLTGIVAETDRYSNEKAAPHTMSVAGILMSAGASTQLVSSKLQVEPKDKKSASLKFETKVHKDNSADNGEIQIDHDNKKSTKTISTDKESEDDTPAEVLPQDDSSEEQKNVKSVPESPVSTRVVKDPPQLGGQLTANSVSEDKRYSGSTDPLSNMPDDPILNKSSNAPLNVNSDDQTFSDLEINDDQTLKAIEKSVDSPHVTPKDMDPPSSSLDEVRDAVQKAVNNGEPNIPEPREDMGTKELGSDLNDQNPDDEPPAPPVPPPMPMPPAS